MSFVTWSIVGFLLGSVPFSPLLSRWVLGKNLRAFGDGNPGATNVFRAGGRWAGVAAMLLDGFKGAIPVGWAYWAVGVRGWDLIPVSLAPVLGHAFSPFLRGRGGKAVATTFGIWTGLTGPEAPIVLGCLLGIWFLTLRQSGWAMAATMACFGLHLLNYRPDPAWLSLWALNTALLLWKYREDLRHWPAINTDLARKLLGRPAA